MATSDRPARAAAAVALAAAAAALVLAGCASSQAQTVPAGHLAAARAAPASWRHAALPDGAAVLAFPPDMHQVSGDKGTVSVAKLSKNGTFQLYLNATPKQGNETLADWPGFRLDHLTDDDASSDHLIAENHNVRFLGGTGTCVVDSYVTKAKSHHFTELACYVKGSTSSSVIVAAAPTADWAAAAPVLKQAVAAYQAH